MAKGGYFIIGYPPIKPDDDPFDIQAVVDSIQASGGEVAYILHDKDVKEDGTLKEPHYHILCMWAKSPMKWDDFVSWMKQNHCSCPDMEHKGKTRDDNKYCKRTAVVRDVDACLAYMLHA